LFTVNLYSVIAADCYCMQVPHLAKFAGGICNIEILTTIE